MRLTRREALQAAGAALVAPRLALAHQAVAIVLLTIVVMNLERLSPRQTTLTSKKLAAAGSIG